MKELPSTLTLRGQTRRSFLHQLMVGGFGAACWWRGIRPTRADNQAPSFLRGYESLYRENPRKATRAWFVNARYGMFVHYALASLAPGGKRDPWSGKAAELEEQFTADGFDADAIADLAVEAEMRYINFTPYHGGGPYLFRSNVVGPASLDLPAGRDLTAEMANACEKRGLGLFLYVHVSLSQSHDEVAERNEAVLRELLTQYGPLAGLWFDTDHLAYRHPERFPLLDETYGLVRELQPQALISFCRGVTGEEDFVSYEHYVRDRSGLERFIAPEAEERLRQKPVEICTTLQLNPEPAEGAHPGAQMWFHVEDAIHRTADDVWELLADARCDDANLLLNIAPRGDGSLHPEEVRTLRSAGKRIREQGWPAPWEPAFHENAGSQGATLI